MFRKNSKVFGSRRLKGIIYIAAQFLGGFIAAVMAKILVNDKDHIIAVQPMPDPEDGDPRAFASMISELVGSFVFIFLFMLCTDKKTQYSEDKVINCFIMASSYVSARLMGGGNFVTVVDTGNQYMKYNYLGPLLNPALALGQMIFAWWQFKYIYIYFLMPFCGSAAALVFYEFVFVRSQEYLNEESSEGSEGGLSIVSDNEKLNQEIQKQTQDEAETLEDD